MQNNKVGRINITNDKVGYDTIEVWVTSQDKGSRVEVVDTVKLTALKSQKGKYTVFILIN